MVARLRTCWIWIVMFAIVDATAVGYGADANPAKRHALLIGCTKYPELKNCDLTGPSNDVQLAATLLRDRFGFTDKEIVTLTHNESESGRPTRKNITRAFAELGERVREGDIVFILLAGHGSQHPDDNPDDPDDFEPDGRDEVFLPEDVPLWKFRKPINRAISDDEIRKWLDAIRDKGATVFFVADTCCSGTIDRGPADDQGFVRSRYVDPSLLSPPAELEAVENIGRKRSRTSAGESRSTDGWFGIADTPQKLQANRGGLVALYAVSDNEKEREHPMPPEENADEPWYGRLSFAMSWVLSRTNRPLTYRELAQQIQWQYEAWNWWPASFMIASEDQLDREVLGQQSWANRSAVELTRDEYGNRVLNVGELHGAVAGNVYRVFPPAGADADDHAVGYVEVTEAAPTWARVEECQFEDGVIRRERRRSVRLPDRGRCELAYQSHGDARMAIGVAPWDPDIDADLTAIRTAVETIASQPRSLVRLVEEGETPDAFVLARGDEVYLRRTFDVTRGDDGSLGESSDFPSDTFGPFQIAEGTGQLERSLKAMAKAMYLRRLAESEVGSVAIELYDQVSLDIRVEKWNPLTGKFETIDRIQPLELTDGDKMQVLVFNRGRSPVDVTILYVESGFRIRSYFPTRRQAESGFFNRIAPDDPSTPENEGQPARANFTINDSTTGLEDVIVIATAPIAGQQLQSFAFLEQEGLRSTPTRGDASLLSPLGELIAAAAYGQGERGGNSPAEAAKYSINRISWMVRKRPASSPDPAQRAEFDQLRRKGQ